MNVLDQIEQLECQNHVLLSELVKVKASVGLMLVDNEHNFVGEYSPQAIEAECRTPHAHFVFTQAGGVVVTGPGS